MPEGPECTIVADQLDTAARGWSLTNVELLTGRYTKKEPVGFSEFMDDLGKDGKYIHSVSNKGKFNATEYQQADSTANGLFHSGLE